MVKDTKNYNCDVKSNGSSLGNKRVIKLIMAYLNDSLGEVMGTLQTNDYPLPLLILNQWVSKWGVENTNAREPTFNILLSIYIEEI